MTGFYQSNSFESCPPSVPRAALAQQPAAGPFSAGELADLRLASLPQTKRGITALAEREGWAFVDRIGHGGGRCYGVDALPLPARADLYARLDDADRRATTRSGRPKGSGFFGRHPDVADAVRVELGERRVAAQVILQKLDASGQFATLPTLRTLQRFIAQLEDEEAATLAALRDPQLFKNKYKVALGDAAGGVTFAHELWEIDTTPADVLTLEGRKHILQIVDRWSRRARFLVVDSESARSVSRMIAGTMLAWGVTPRAILTDNGSGFINASVVSSLEALGIDHQTCLPGQPWRKPFVERLFGTFTRERAEVLPGYVGHSVADAGRERAAAKARTGRAVIEAAITPDELQAVLDGWTDGVYHLRRHSKLGCSPMERWQSSPTPARASPTAAQLLLALSKREGVRTVGKKGVQCFGMTYWSPVCVEWMGRELVARSDEDDLGCLHLFSPDGDYLDTAVNQGASGLSQRDFALEAARLQNEALIAERAADAKRRRKYDPVEVAQKLLRQDAERAGKVTALPIATVAHSTPQLDTMVPAARPAPSTETRAILGEIAKGTAPVTHLPRTPRQKIAEADALLAAAATGKPVDADKLRAARAYAASAQYRAIKDVDAFVAAGARA